MCGTEQNLQPTFPRVQTGYSTAQNPQPTYQQNTGTPGPLQSSTDSSQNRQNDFTGQFYPVTPSSGGYTPAPGSYNNANAGYQSPSPNYYSTGNTDFNTSPPQFPILNPSGSAYNNENSAGGEYGQPTGEYGNQGSQGSQSGAIQNQWSGSSSTPPNYIAPQVWDGGYYSTSSSSSSVPYTSSSGDQSGASYGPSSQPSYGADTSDHAQTQNDVGSSWEPTPPLPSSQWMQGGSYSDTTSSDQNQPYEQSSTPPSGQYYGGFSSSTNYPGTTAFQYTSTQNPLSLTPPPDAATSAWSYNEGAYSSTQSPYRDESSSSAGQQGMNTPFAASYGDSTPGSTQGYQQGYQEFASSTQAAPSSSEGYVSNKKLVIFRYSDPRKLSLSQSKLIQTKYKGKTI
ncbi:unnamed protein product [Cylicostephanus goldi]|uniref:Uncharacterized protein n=1 Tax=Cylicostephanus goldi TaxID=71465 RepID=A0A3P6QFX3_CYLGO|nr:unnamed protein product [Cylicostephanus goldi]